MDKKIKALRRRIVKIHRSIYDINKVAIDSLCFLEEIKVRDINIISKNGTCHITIVLDDDCYSRCKTFSDAMRWRTPSLEHPIYKNEHIVKYSYTKDIIKDYWQMFNHFKSLTNHITIHQEELEEKECLA